MSKNKYRVFVYANLKPSQIKYKILPLSQSSMVEHVFILRKTPLLLNEEKITCLYLPWILRQRPIYWFITPFYGLLLMHKYQTNLLLNYNIFPHGFNAYLSSIISKQKVIFSEINEDTIRYYNKFITNWLIKRILKNASIICTPGLNTASFWNRVGFNNTFQLHSTIDIEKFKPDPTALKEYDYIYIGTLDRNKRPDLIIKAFYEILQNNSTATLCILGFGSMENYLRNLVINLAIENQILFIKTDNVINYLQKSKILIMASLSEGIPCAMMEAMAVELIVIVPNVGDISYIIEHNKNGFLYNNSKSQLILYMKEALNNYNNLQDIKTSARLTIISKHSYQEATKKWNLLLSKC